MALSIVQGGASANNQGSQGGTGTGSGSGSAGSWGMATGTKAGYDPNKFYVSATDSNGHGDTVSVKFPTEVVHQMYVMTHSEDFPDYNSPQDFIRDAVKHWLHKRADEVGEPAHAEAIRASLQRAIVADGLARAKAEADIWDTMCDDLDATMTRLAAARAWNRVWEHLTIVEESAETVAEPYRTQFITKIAEWKQRVPEQYRVDQ